MKSNVSEMQHDIEHEKKLIEALGYHLIGPDIFNRWVIIDENGNETGCIKYKKLYNKNKKTGYPATYGYHMVISNPSIDYNSVRRTTDKNGNQITDNKFSYEFGITKNNGYYDRVVVNAGKSPYLELWSEENGHIF